MEYYSTIKNTDFMKFTSKWMDLENNLLSEVTQSQNKTHGMHSLINGYYPSFVFLLIQFTDHMKFEKKKNKSVDASVLLIIRLLPQRNV